MKLKIEEIRVDERKKIVEEINKLIETGDLGGNGCDRNAERNGLILASNIVMRKLSGYELPEKKEKKMGMDKRGTNYNATVDYKRGVPIISVLPYTTLDEAAEECTGIMKLHSFDFAILLFKDVKLEVYPYTTIDDLMIEYVGKIK